FVNKIERSLIFFFQAEDGIRDRNVTGVQTCALPILGGTKSKSNSLIYHYNKELDFDFVPPTNDAVLKDVSEKFGISIQEVEKIWLNIEKSIYGKLKNNN